MLIPVASGVGSEWLPWARENSKRSEWSIGYLRVLKALKIAKTNQRR